jgi:hypothetical protein
MKIKFFEKKKVFRKDSGIKPDLCWRYILYITFILILTAFAFGFYVFMKINQDSISPSLYVLQQKGIERARFDGVLNYFTASEKKSTDILNSPSPVKDPSL